MDTKRTAIQNAKITSTTLGLERGTMNYLISLEGHGWAQSFGGYSLSGNPRFGLESIRDVISAVGGDHWEDLPGRLVRVKRTPGISAGSRIVAIGHIVEDIWYDIDQHARTAGGSATVMLICKVLEVSEDGAGRHGIMFQADDRSEFFIPCRKEVVRLAAKQLTEDVELTFRPAPSSNVRHGAQKE